MPEPQEKPDDFLIVLALGMQSERPTFADEVRGTLKQLGFDATAQQVGAWLKRLAAEDLPTVERTQELYRPGSQWVYKLTHWGWNELRERGLRNLGMPARFPHA